MTDGSPVLIAAPVPAEGTARLCCVAIKDGSADVAGGLRRERSANVVCGTLV